MKKESGITLVALIVYLMIVSAILAALTNLSSHVYKNIDKLGSENLSAEEFNKFNVNFVKSVKANKKATVTNNNQNVLIILLQMYKILIIKMLYKYKLVQGKKILL